jgi:hypothetical protein
LFIYVSPFEERHCKSKKHKSLERCRRNTPISVQGPNDIYFLGRVVKHERIGERERGEGKGIREKEGSLLEIRKR